LNIKGFGARPFMNNPKIHPHPKMNISRWGK